MAKVTKLAVDIHHNFDGRTLLAVKWVGKNGRPYGISKITDGGPLAERQLCDLIGQVAENILDWVPEEVFDAAVDTVIDHHES